MRILWLCNIVLPELCGEFGFKNVVAGGWLTGMWEELKRKPDFSLGICVPIIKEENMRDGEFQGYKYYSFQIISKENKIDILEEQFLSILDRFNPDIIHIWGTEYLHSFAMVQACHKRNMLKCVVINIQGLVSVINLHYGMGLPKHILNKKVEGHSINDEIIDFKERGKYEKKLLQKVYHVVGRTDWDTACVLRINPQLNYYRCGEILRNIFYNKDNNWNADKCEKYSIFISQAGYAVKGFHLVLKMLKELSMYYPKLKVYIAGSNIWDMNTSYACYIQEKIKEYDLNNIIKFVGILQAENMMEYYLKANVFLSSSVIENSSNSICEALRVGIPVVSSYVGGVTSMMEHEKSGFFYPLGEEYMAEYYIRNIFDDKQLANKISENGRKQAQKLNDKEVILKTIENIYQLVKKEASYE